MNKQESNKQSRKASIYGILQISLGIFLASLGLKAFLLPNGFIDGGITGVALLGNYFLGIDFSILLVLLSIPLLLLAYFKISRLVFFKSLASIIGLAIVIYLENFERVTEDKLLISIFGGLFLGMGIGISLRNGAVLDAAEIIGVYLNHRFGISIGKIILAFNVILFSFTAVLTSLETALYSILAFSVTAKVTDFIIEGFEDFIGIMIVSKNSEEIRASIIEKLGAGITVYKGMGGFGKTPGNYEKPILHSIINRIDLMKVHRLIDQIDPEAFVVEFDVNNVKGGVLRRYLNT